MDIRSIKFQIELTRTQRLQHTKCSLEEIEGNFPNSPIKLINSIMYHDKIICLRLCPKLIYFDFDWAGFDFLIFELQIKSFLID